MNFSIYFIFFQSGGSVNICEVTPEVKEALKKFRFRKTQDTAALICKYQYCVTIIIMPSSVKVMQVVIHDITRLQV